MKTKSQKRKGNLPGSQHMRCPYCGSTVHLRSANGIYRYNNENTLLYVCSQYPVCDSYVRVHPGTKIPVGSLANAELRALRLTAHRHFDKLYKTGLMSKNDAYNWLSFILQSPLSQAHIGYQNEYHCNLIIRESNKMLDNFSWKLKNNTGLGTFTGGDCHAAQ